MQQHWAMSRMIAFYNVAMVGGKVEGKKVTKASDLFKLGIDNSEKVKEHKIAVVTKVDGND